jgi:hypothetical protein
MGLLSGGVASVFSAAFGSFYLDGTLEPSSTDPVYDDEGNIVGYGGGSPVAVKVQIDSATEAMRGADGYTEGDCRMIILAHGIPAVTTDMSVTARDAKFKLMSADLDPAASHWVCRAREVRP